MIGEKLLTLQEFQYSFKLINYYKHYARSN